MLAQLFKGHIYREFYDENLPLPYAWWKLRLGGDLWAAVGRLYVEMMIYFIEELKIVFVLFIRDH